MHDPPRQGYLTGQLTLEDAMGQHDLADRVWSGPTPMTMDRARVVCHGAKFILLVEKRNMLEKLKADRFHLDHSAILVTGDGYPGTRFHILLKNLSDQLQLPFYVLADNDPPGFLLFFLIARGRARKNSQPRESLAIPNAQFLGVCFDDAERFNLNKNVQIELRDEDKATLRQLQATPWLNSNSAWQREFDLMLKRNSKLELEAMYSIPNSGITDIYLPERLKDNDYLHL